MKVLQMCKAAQVLSVWSCILELGNVRLTQVGNTNYESSKDIGVVIDAHETVSRENV